MCPFRFPALYRIPSRVAERASPHLAWSTLRGHCSRCSRHGVPIRKQGLAVRVVCALPLELPVELETPPFAGPPRALSPVRPWYRRGEAGGRQP